MVVVPSSQRLLSLIPTTVLVVCLLGLWLLLGCGNLQSLTILLDCQKHDEWWKSYAISVHRFLQMSLAVTSEES